jgi:hypothetical protein
MLIYSSVSVVYIPQAVAKFGAFPITAHAASADIGLCQFSVDCQHSLIFRIPPQLDLQISYPIQHPNPRALMLMLQDCGSAMALY